MSEQSPRDEAAQIARREFQRLDIQRPERPEDAMARVVDALLVAGWVPPSAPRQAASIEAAVLREVADWWDSIQPNVTRDQVGAWLRRRAEVRQRAAGIPVQDAPLPSVTRTQVRAAAHALFTWNTEHPDYPRFVIHDVTGPVDREPYGALVDEVLYHLGIRVQDGGSDAAE